MSGIDDLRETVSRLRAPDGCPWDRAQTHRSLSECLIEECAELLDTIDREDYDHMKEELGDVLLQVVMHAQLAEECERFDFDSVAKAVNEKLIRRHPHVFGDVIAGSPEEAISRWEAIKAAEKPDAGGNVGLTDRLPPNLPSLLFAKGVYRELEKRNLLADSGVALETSADSQGTIDEAEVGARLFKIAAICKRAGIDPESALRRYASQLVERFAHAESDE